MIRLQLERRRNSLFVLLATVLIFISSFNAIAQQDMAKLEGIIRDTNGAIVSGATITIRSEANSIERTATASDDGVYSLPQLRPGKYALIVTQSNFSTTQVNDLELGVGQTRTLDVELRPGEIGANVTITASEDPATIDAGSNRLGVNVTAREVQELPVNGRNYSQLQLTSPGAQNTGTGNFNEIRFNGRSNEQNQTKLDGVESSAIFDQSPGYLTVQGSQFRLQTSLENIQEFRVDSSNYPAEYGTGTGGQINVIGKSGGNAFHGSVFEYLRNDALDARNYFDAERKSPLRLNQFGGSMSGRIIRDRLFFFGSYEGLRQRAGFNVIELTPSNFARDFINFFGTADPRGEAARAALGISAADANSALARIQALRATGAINAFPVGTGTPINLGGANQSAQFVQTNRTARLDEDAFSIRLDGKINQRFNIYGRYQRDKGDLASPDGTTGRFLLATQQPDNFVVALQQLYGTSIVNETKFGINRSPTTLITSVPDVTGLTGFELAGTAFRLGGNIVSPGVNGGTTTGLAEPGGLTRQSSAGNGRAQPVEARSFSLIDNLTWTRGNHSFKFGAEFRLIRVDFDQLGGTALSFGNVRDFLLNQNLTAAFIGDLSVPGDFRIATNPVTTFSRPTEGFHKGRQKYLIFYGQDEWRIRRNLTINYGLRYEYYSPNSEQDDRAILFDVGTGRLIDPSTTNLYKSSKNNFGPRLAVTWSPERFGGKTVFRLGGGLYYGPGQYEDLIQPIESDVFRTTQTIAGGLTTSTLAGVANTNLVVSQFTPRAYDVNGYRVPERVAQYGFSIQQELPGNTVLTVGYVGSQGRNLFQRSIANKILPGSTIIGPADALPTGFGVVNRCSVALTANQCVGGQITQATTIREFDVVGFAINPTTGAITANPASRLQPFGEIDYKTSGGRDNYNALQVTVNRRFSAGLTLGGQYQWAHSIGTTQGSNEAQTAQDPYNFEDERGNNTFDIRHSANLSLLYELPFGKGRKYGFDGLANTLLGGWQLGGVYNGRSGTPLDIRVTRADLAVQCVNAALCNLGELRRFTAPSATSPLPAGFAAVVNTPGGNASRNTRRPDLVAGVNPYLNNASSDPRFFLNPAAFAIPRAGTYGNLSRNALFGPSFHQFDLTFQKRFKLTETANVEFRTEIYNIFNKANFANPPVTLAEALPPTNGGAGLQPGQPFSFTQVPNFGLINATVGRTVGLGTNRQLQFALRFNF